MVRFGQERGGDAPKPAAAHDEDAHTGTCTIFPN
jgi:hypothetical protein